MNKTYKYTLTAHEKKEISFDTGVARLAIANGNGVDGSTTVIMTEITKQHSGDLVSFIDGADAPFADFIVDIVATQSGTGDPSPTNIRLITGWTGANIYKKGFNLWDEEWELGVINATTGENSASTTQIRSTNYIPIKSNTVYYVNSHGVTMILRFYDKNKTYLGADKSMVANNSTVTTPTDAYYVRFYLNAQYGAIYNNDISINYPSIDTAYHAYNSNSETINIDWEDEAGTVYGGTLDVKTGVLTVTHVCNRITTISSVGATGQSATFYLSQLAYSHIISESDLKCNCLKPSNYSPNYDNHVHFANTSICALYFADVIGETKAEWEEYLDENPLYICYKIATPITYQLTPTEVRSLLGQNNIWADCGAVNVRYFVQSTQPMVDYIDEKTIVYFDAQEDFSTYDISLVGATSTDIKNYLLANKNANIVIRVKRYSTILLYYLREYSPNYFAEFATHAVIFDAEGTKSMRIDYLRLDLTQETTDFTNDHIILPVT